MVNLILDTNQWVYLANALDPHTNHLQPGHHFKLLQKILEMVEAQEITLWKTDLVLVEWNRNKEHAYDLTKKLKNQRTDAITKMKKLNEDLGKDADTHVDWLIDAIKKHYTALIKQNKEHIAKVEFLVSSARTFFIRDKVYSEVTRWAIEKKAPFRGDKSNSNADAAILFGAIDYFNRMRTNDEPPPATAFVSANIRDYCSTAQGKTQTIHEDLQDKLEEIGMQFFVSLPQALQHINDSLMPKDEWEEIDRLFNRRFGEMKCMSCSPNDSFALDACVGFREPVIIFPADYTEAQNEDEQEEIGGKEVSGNIDSAVIQIGFCGSCSIAHIRCACGNVLCAEDKEDELLTCRECERKYSLDYDFDSSELDTVWLVVDNENTGEEDE
ncbi:hypothetical protein SAMN04488128_1011163 [Chitinophaga eiseniae]|uniref:DUF4935 domain-containing protein n=1 Tax=Chitinophaga eiseniae TaxID=634771 RepID=A0A1T4MLF3_9BACT|nr:PIN domain-containing protein [Chitinophaga eiseniae]SJZ67869.1 hypothetical protein SAMN04488128_1011163 [Chitinophaga eiseniae]